jgi:protein required for attachment to host cells
VTNPHRTLIVVAHRGGARFFEYRGHGEPWALVESVDHPEGTQNTSEIVSDQQGQSMDSHRHDRHGVSSSVDPTEHVAEKFAHTLAERLRHLRVDNDLGRVVLVAPPAFLGLLRGTLDEPTRKLVAAELAGGFAHEGFEAIRDALSEQIRL